MTCRIDEFRSDFEATRTWSKSKLESRSSNQVDLELLQQKLQIWLKSKFVRTNRQSNLLFKQLIARLIWYKIKIWSNALCESDLISSRSNDRLRFKRRDRQSKFVLRSSMLSSTDLCVHWSVLIHFYDDDTVQVSILYECSLLIELSTRFHCYLMCDLYRCVSHMTHANLMRSDYLSIYLIDKIFCSHTNHQHTFVFAFEKDLALNSLDVRVENDHNSVWKNVSNEETKNDKNQCSIFLM
jgi:hypothetical protein